MKRVLFVFVLVCLGKNLHAQYIYTIKADSVKITNSCDTAELIIENHTQTVPGFLFNKGRGRTEFRRPLFRIDDSLYLVGIDTLRLSSAWLQGGNRFSATGKFGTLDNNHIDFYTNNTQRVRLTSTGTLLLGTTADDGNRLQINGLISLKNTEAADIKSPRFQVLIGDESGGSGSALLFHGDAVSRGPINIGRGHSNNFRKFLIQTSGQPGDTAATYNFTYNSIKDHALNIYNFADGKSKLFLTATGNLLLSRDSDNGDKLQVNGNVFANGNKHLLGAPGTGANSRV